jgi:UDP-glucose 4-epimerase
VAIYANNDKAKSRLGWDPQKTIDDMMATAWQWELKLKEDEAFFATMHSELN